MNVLVTDGENRAALAVTRSLGRRGCSVFVVGRELESISSTSQFCRRAFRVPDPLNETGQYIDAVAKIISSEDIDIVFPVSEQSIFNLSAAREKLGEHVILACAPFEKMKTISNKYRLFQAAERLNVAVPKTIYVSGIDDFEFKRVQVTGFPVVVKPAFSKIRDGEHFLSAGVMYAFDHNQLSRLYEIEPVLRYPSLIQEFIAGEGTGLFTLFDRNRHLVLFSHRRLLEKPPTGGVSVLSESVPLDSEMVEFATRLLSDVEWSGVAMVEFKRDIRDGKVKLMEINGRFWGSLQLAVASGVDFPSLCLDFYLGNSPALEIGAFTVGHRLKWFIGILDHILIRMKTKSELYKLSDPAPIRQVIMELLTLYENNTSSDVFDYTDLKPIASEIKTYIKNIIRQRL